MKTMPKVVVVVPVKNEDWILDAFLRACSKFADHIVIGDHFSTDKSREIARSFEKVKLVQSVSKEFDERERRNQLLIEARKFGECNLIISLDADEFFSGPISSSLLEKMLREPPGTHFKMKFLNLSPDLIRGWVTVTDPVAFIDDGSLHLGSANIHFPRLPLVGESREIFIEDLEVVHLQYIDKKRMESKHRWYKVWERINFPKKSAIEIYRRYNHMYAVSEDKFVELTRQTQSHLNAVGVNLQELSRSRDDYWWDYEVGKLISSRPLTDFQFVIKPPSEDALTIPQKLFFFYADVSQIAMKLNLVNPIRLTVRAFDKIFLKFWL